MRFLRRLFGRHLPLAVLASIIALIIFIVGFARQQVAADRRGTIESNYLHAEILAQSLHQHVSGTLALAEDMASNAASLAAEALQAGERLDTRYLSKIRSAAPVGRVIFSVVVVDSQFNVLAHSYPEKAGFPARSEQPHFRYHVNHPDARGTRVGAPFRSPVQRFTWLLPVTHAVRNRAGHLIAVVSVALRPAYFIERYGSIIEPINLLLALQRDSGELITASHAPSADGARPAETLPADAGQAGRFQQVSAIDGRQRLFAYRHLAPYPVHVLVGADLETMLHPWRERRQHAIWLTAGICGAAAAVGLILLALAQRLERRREQFRLAAHAAGVAIWDRQMRKHRFFITREYLERLGYDPRRFGHSLGELLKLVHPEDRARLDDAFFALDASSPAIDATFRLRASDGGYRWFHASGQVVETLLGRPTRISGTLVDVHERKVAEDELRALSARLEQLVDQRTRDLRAANEELEAFSYSVSHDLRAPLRSISGFSEILVQDHAEQLPPDAKPLLRRIVCATERMGALIDDLLALARAARAPITLNPVDLSALADSVAESLRQHEPERKAEFEIAPGLTATADAGLMRIVLENLIANAWKFSRRREVTRIAVGREHTARGDAFYVRDNGSGLDMRYADRLFKPFQRLHHERDFEGTGIGLATVARIVRRHGGAVWIESAPDQGATVYFTLPAPSADASSESLGTSA